MQGSSLVFYIYVTYRVRFRPAGRSGCLLLQNINVIVSHIYDLFIQAALSFSQEKDRYMERTGKHKRSNIFIYIYLILVFGLLLIPRYSVAQATPVYGEYPAFGHGGSNGNFQSFREYVTPEDETVKMLVSGLETVTDIYNEAVSWVYVTERTLNGKAEKWLTTEQFLRETPDYPSNPLPGEWVSDCEEQANTLVSLLRAAGVPADDVRVVLGRYIFNGKLKGHAWVELWYEGTWLALDPSSGPYWDDNTERLVNRPGVPFDYYRTQRFPVSRIDLYYNDVYYYEPGGRTDSSPSFWQE